MTVPFIVMSAPNGARRGRDDHPALPITSDEIAECAECVEAAGASIIHIHVRDENCKHSLDVDRYRATIDAIRDRVQDRLIIQITTESCGIYTPQQQVTVVKELKPEAVSLALRELCPDENSETGAAEFFAWMNENDVMPQYILYSPEEVTRFETLRDRGIIPDDWPFVLFVLGSYVDSTAGDPGLLSGYVARLNPDVQWAVCCFGETEFAAITEAGKMNGHARVGFENNLILPSGDVSPDNAASVMMARACGGERRLATADDVREMLF